MPIDRPNRQAAVDLSVILPFRDERESLPELLGRLRRVLDPLELPYELLFVDDGSSDDGAAYLEEQALEDARIKLLVLSRNFGQHLAATAGIDFAQGTMVVWMDSDLQERPEDIPRLIAKHREGFDVVYARRRRRQQHPLRAAVSAAFLGLLNRLVRLNVPADRACMRLFSARVVQSLRQIEERNRYMAYLMPWAGFRSAEIEIEVDPRRRGETKYSWRKLITLGLTGLTSFSVAPLRVAAFFSCVTIGLCGIGVVYVLYRYFVYGIIISGWASLIIAMLALHAMEFAVLAVLGEYVGLTYTESKRRPLYLLSRVINVRLDATDRRENDRAQVAWPIRSLPTTGAVPEVAPAAQYETDVQEARSLTRNGDA